MSFHRNTLVTCSKAWKDFHGQVIEPPHLSSAEMRSGELECPDEM